MSIVSGFFNDPAKYLSLGGYEPSEDAFGGLSYTPRKPRAFESFSLPRILTRESQAMDDGASAHDPFRPENGEAAAQYHQIDGAIDDQIEDMENFMSRTSEKKYLQVVFSVQNSFLTRKANFTPRSDVNPSFLGNNDGDFLENMFIHTMNLTDTIGTALACLTFKMTPTRLIGNLSAISAIPAFVIRAAFLTLGAAICAGIIAPTQFLAVLAHKAKPVLGSAIEGLFIGSMLAIRAIGSGIKAVGHGIKIAAQTTFKASSFGLYHLSYAIAALLISGVGSIACDSLLIAYLAVGLGLSVVGSGAGNLKQEMQNSIDFFRVSSFTIWTIQRMMFQKRNHVELVNRYVEDWTKVHSKNNAQREGISERNLYGILSRLADQLKRSKETEQAEETSPLFGHPRGLKEPEEGLSLDSPVAAARSRGDSHALSDY